MSQLTENNSVHKEHNKVEAMGIAGAYSPFIDATSSSRIGMTLQHHGSAVVTKHPDLPPILNGTEVDLAKYVFGAKASTDMEIISIIDLNPLQPHLSPRSVVIYYDLIKKVYDALVIEKYHNNHFIFGFESKLTEDGKNLSPGDVIKKDTVLSSTRNVIDGIYSNGNVANVLYVPHDSVIEDGYRMSESWIKRTSALVVGNFDGPIGVASKRFPLNLYGDEQEYKICPDEGEKVRDDGLLIGFREYNEDTAVFDFSPEELRKPRQSDHLVYASNPDAVVLEIDVIDSTLDGIKPKTSLNMVRQLQKYSERKQTKYNEPIINAYEKLFKDNGKDINLFGPKFLQLVKEAMEATPNKISKRYNSFAKGKINKTRRAVQLDEFHISIRYGYYYKPGLTAKYTGHFGDKGVACAIVPDHLMPFDEFGNVADVIIHPVPSTKRLNAIQQVEHYINAATRDVTSDIKEMVAAKNIDQAIDLLTNYMKVVSKIDYERWCGLSKPKQVELVKGLANGDVYRPLIPADNDWISFDTILDIDKVRKPNKGKVFYRDENTGEVIEYLEPMLIAPRYFMTLDKMVAQPMATSISPLQHHGLPSTLNKTIKTSFPSYRKAPRETGNSEVRYAAAFDGAENLAHLMDISNNPSTQAQGAINLMTAANPAQLDELVDRDKIPLGTARNLQLPRHLISGYGIEIEKVTTDD